MKSSSYTGRDIFIAVYASVVLTFLTKDNMSLRKNEIFASSKVKSLHLEYHTENTPIYSILSAIFHPLTKPPKE